MSNYISGSDRQITKIMELALNKLGKFPYVENLPVDIPSIKGNRLTKAQQLLKVLSEEGGFNMTLWRFPNVIKVPTAVGRKWIDSMDREQPLSEKELKYYERGFCGNYFYCRWDGDHRQKLFKAFMGINPNEVCDLTYDCMVYEVDNVSEGNGLFVKIQKTRQKSLTPEDEWANQWLAHDLKAREQGRNMIACQVSVKDSNGDFYPNTLYGYWITSRLFNKCVNDYGLEITKKAIADMIKVLSVKPNWNKEVYATAYFGLATLYHYRPDVAKNGINKNIINMLQKFAESPKNEFIEIFKQRGGNQHNKEAESFAYGVADFFNKMVKDGSYGNNPNHAGPLKINSLHEDLFPKTKKSGDAL